MSIYAAEKLEDNKALFGKVEQLIYAGKAE